MLDSNGKYRANHHVIRLTSRLAEREFLRRRSHQTKWLMPIGIRRPVERNLFIVDTRRFIAVFIFCETDRA